jgi:hypothetical protein
LLSQGLDVAAMVRDAGRRRREIAVRDRIDT